MGDRLSDLPTGILHQILARLPFDEQVRTGILSTRWRRLWSANPVLRLDRLHPSCSDDDDRDRYAERLVAIVDHCLLLCSGLEKLQSLYLPVTGGPSHASALRRWLRFAADRSVAELVLRLRLIGVPRALVPVALFDCRDLTVLKMESCHFPSLPSDASLHSLKTLFLYRVDISSDTLHALLPLCPSIEHFTLTRCDQVSRVSITSPTMKSLEVYDCDRLQLLEIISAPQLRNLVYSGDILKLASLEGAPHLEEATLLSHSRRPFGDRRSWRKFLSSIARVRSLSVNRWFLDFSLDAGLFENLRELHWWPVYQKSTEPWNGELFTAASLRALISTLGHLPSLELLCVHRNFYDEEDEDEVRMNWMVMEAARDEFGFDMPDDDDCPFDDDDDDTWTDPLEEYEGIGYVLPQLKKLKVIEFSGKGVETRMVKFLLDKAVALESLVIYYVPEVAEELSGFDTTISEMCKASPLVRTLLLELPNDPCPKVDSVLRSRCTDL